MAKLALKGVGGFALSPNQDAPNLAAVVPEAKGCPGFAGVWPLASLSKSGESTAPVARRSFFRVWAALFCPANTSRTWQALGLSDHGISCICSCNSNISMCMQRHPAFPDIVMKLTRIRAAACACTAQATSAKLMWNAKGTAVLVLTATDVDATNQSYYGEQKLSFLAADGRNDCIVPLKVFNGCH